MPTLNWIGKEAVVNHHQQVPFHLLKDVPSLSCGTPGDGNLIVQGDNLVALKALLPYYAGQVKCIYIDPPYNTGNEGWMYNDNVNSPVIREWLGKVVGKEGETLDRHDRWLCMMYPRLALLRQFLREDGAIFVSIDDDELHSLRVPSSRTCRLSTDRKSSTARAASSAVTGCNQNIFLSGRRPTRLKCHDYAENLSNPRAGFATRFLPSLREGGATRGGISAGTRAEQQSHRPIYPSFSGRVAGRDALRVSPGTDRWWEDVTCLLRHRLSDERTVARGARCRALARTEQHHPQPNGGCPS